MSVVEDADDSVLSLTLLLTTVLLSLTKGSSTGDEAAVAPAGGVGSNEGEVTGVGVFTGATDGVGCAASTGGAGDGVEPSRDQTVATFEFEELTQAGEKKSADAAKTKTALFFEIINFRISNLKMTPSQTASSPAK